MAAVNPIVSDVVLSTQRTALNNLIGGNEERCVSVVVCNQYNSPFSVPGQLKQVSCTHALCWTRYKAALIDCVHHGNCWKYRSTYFTTSRHENPNSGHEAHCHVNHICVAQYILPIFLGLALISLAWACAIDFYRLCNEIFQLPLVV